MTNTIVFDKKDGSSEQMSLDEFARWASLAEAFHFIETKASEMGMDSIDKLIKPLAIEQYISERFPSMRHDVGVEYRMGNL